MPCYLHTFLFKRIQNTLEIGDLDIKRAYSQLSMNKLVPGVVMQAHNPSTHETEVGGLKRAQGQHGIQ